MQLRVVLVQTLLTSCMIAQSFGPKLANLIPSDARFVYGMDVGRYRQSPISSFYPISVEGLTNISSGDWLRHINRLVVVGHASDGPGRIAILSGSVGSLLPSIPEMRNDLSGLPGFALLDAFTAIFGDPESVRSMVQKWRKESRGELGVKVSRLSDSYDNWFIVVRPLENLGASDPMEKLKFGSNFAGMVEELRGGIRFGADSAVRIEAEMKTAEDAMALAALGRWLPGFVQLRSPHSRESHLAELIESLTVISTGNVVSVSFTLNEGKVSELIESLEAENRRWK